MHMIWIIIINITENGEEGECCNLVITQVVTHPTQRGRYRRQPDFTAKALLCR